MDYPDADAVDPREEDDDDLDETEDVTEDIEDDESDDEPELKRSSLATPASAGRGLVVALGGAIVVILVLLVSVVRISSDRDDVRDRFDELATEARFEEEVLITANEFLVSFVNFDAATIDEDFDRIISYATGEFALEVDTFNDPVVRNNIRERQVQSRGEVVDIWVQEIDNDRARVFAVVDQTIQNNEPRLTTDQLRMEIGLVRSDGAWRIFDLGLLQAQGTLAAGGLQPVPTTAGPTATPDPPE